jgi:LacI family transcriptional regulator
LDSASGLTAILSAADRMAAGALAAAHQYGIAILWQLSVAGFDEEPLVSKVWRRLTTMHKPIQAMAERADGLLMSRGPLFIESSLIVRDSTGPAREPGNA